MSHEPRRPQYGGLARIAEFHGASITAQGVGTGDGCPATNAAAKFGFSRTARPAFTAFALERQETSERLPDDWKLKLPPNVVISRYSPCTSAGLEPAAASSVALLRPRQVLMIRWLAGLSRPLNRAPVTALSTAPCRETACRTAVIEWTDASGQVTAESGRLTEAEQNAMTMLVAISPTGPVARLFEQDTPCPVEILSTTPVAGGFELKLRYLLEGRRRERRERVGGEPFWR